MGNNIIAFLEIRLGKFLCLFLSVFNKFISFFIASSQSPKPTQKIIFVKFIEQGALILHLPTFQEAAKKYGKENIFIATFQSNEALIQILDCFLPSNCFFLAEKSLVAFILSFVGTLRKVRKNNIDSLIDLEFFSCATAIFSYQSGAVKRVGYHRYEGGQNYRGDLFTHKLNYSHYLSVGDSSRSMLATLEYNKPSLPAMEALPIFALNEFSFSPTISDLEELKKLFTAIPFSEKLIVINPSFRDVLPLRAWPVSSYFTCINLLLEKMEDHIFIFTGRADEFQDTENFLGKIPNMKALNFCGKTSLRTLFSLYTVSKLLITSDSGPAHFATLTTLPTIVLFGPETPLLYAPKSNNIHVIYKPLPCSPCYNVYNNRMSSCTNNICLKSISVKEVVDLSFNLLNK